MSPPGFQFTWKIDNFSMLPHQNSKYLKSSYFTVPFFPGTEFFLSLYPKGETKAEKDYLSCFINRRNSAEDPILIRYSLVIESPNSEYNQKCKTHTDIELITGHGSAIFLPLKVLYAHKQYTPQDVLTIVCNLNLPLSKLAASGLNNQLPMKPSFSQHCSMTRIKVGKRCAIWKISNIQYFRYQSKRGNKPLAVLDVPPVIEGTPAFELSFSFDDNADCQHAKIEITQPNSIVMGKNILVKCKITVMSACEEYQHSKEDTHVFQTATNSGQVWYFPDFIENASLVKDKYIHLDNTLYLSCQFSYTIDGDVATHIEIPRYLHSAFRLTSSSNESRLSSRMYHLYEYDKFCDVKIVVGDQTFSTHKVVICAQSPVFRAMFETDMREKNTNIVEIIDVDAETINRMLEFMYCDTLEDDLTYEETLPLYSAADKYEIKHLKEWCTRLLLRYLNVGNTGQTLIVADQHQDFFIMSYVHEYMKNHATEIFHSPEWEKLFAENPVYFGKVMLQVLKDISISYGS